MTETIQSEPKLRSHEEMYSFLEIGTKEVFSLMLGRELEAGQESHSQPGTAFAAMVGLAGDICGVVSVRCGQRAAERIAALMLDLPPEKAVEHVSDALGEVANMVAGNFKNKLNGKNDGCMLSLPTVITGADYRFRSLSVESGMELQFSFENMPLIVKLELYGE
jgi:chemotaxis protein CheX